MAILYLVLGLVIFALLFWLISAVDRA